MKKFTLALSLLSLASCYQPRRVPRHSAPEAPQPMEPTAPTPTFVDEDFYLTVVGKNWNSPAACTRHELAPKDLILSVQTTVASPDVVDLVSDYQNSLIPSFDGVRLDSLGSGTIFETWSTSNSSFKYFQTVEGTITPAALRLTYHVETKYSTGLVCRYTTVVRGKPRTLQDPASLDGVFTTDYYHYGKTDYPALNCPWDVGAPAVSTVYRLDVYDRGEDAIRIELDHGEVEFTLDRRPLPGQKMFWHVPATRGRLWDPFSGGMAWVHGKLEPDEVDLTVKYVPTIVPLVLDPENPPDAEAPRCWFEYRIEGGPKRHFDPSEVDNYYRVRSEIWDQCNTWSTGQPPRVVTEEVVDIVVNASGNEFKVLDNFGFVETFGLFNGNTFAKKETVVYDDGSKNGVTVKWSHKGGFTPPLIEQTTYGEYPRGCIVKTYSFGHARFSF